MTENTKQVFDKAFRPILRQAYVEAYNDALDAVVRVYSNILEKLPKEALEKVSGEYVYKDIIENVPKLKLKADIFEGDVNVQNV